MGYVLMPTGEVVLDPDEQVRGVVRLIFEKFDELGSAWAVFRYLIEADIRVGLRVARGARRGELVWQRPRRGTVERLLHHPIYAGTYTYGRHQYGPAPATGHRTATCRQLPLSEVPFLIPDRLPAYISREQFLANQERLRRNRSAATTPGVPRSGAALLGGLIVCGTCGRRLVTHYHGRGNRPHYACERHLALALALEQVCFGLRAAPVDELVAGEVLRALEPAALELSLQAADDVHRERERIDRYRRQLRERLHHEAEQAERRYQAVDPENRLVARTLERRWEEALKAAREADEEYERFAAVAPPRLSEADLERIRGLASDIPALWRDPETTDADRKEVIRCLIDRVVVAVRPDSQYVEVAIHWQGGVVTQHTVIRPILQYEQLHDYESLVASVRRWHSAGCTPRQIADQLNEAGFRTPRKCRPFKRAQVHELLRRIGLNCGRMSPERLEAGEWWLSDLAESLGVKAATVRRWVARGWVRARWCRRLRCWVVWADRAERKRLRALASVVAVGSNGYPPELTRPRPRPGK